MDILYICCLLRFLTRHTTFCFLQVNIFSVGGSDTGDASERYWGNGIVTSGTRVAGYSIGYALTQREVKALGAAFWNLYGRCG